MRRSISTRASMSSGVVGAEAHADHARAAAIGRRRVSRCQRPGPGRQPSRLRDIGLRAEAAAAHADARLVAEDGRDQRVLDRADVEGDDADPIVVRARSGRSRRRR